MPYKISDDATYTSHVYSYRYRDVLTVAATSATLLPLTGVLPLAGPFGHQPLPDLTAYRSLTAYRVQSDASCLAITVPDKCWISHHSCTEPIHMWLLAADRPVLKILD